MDTMACRYCGEPIRRTTNVWVHDGLAETVYCLAGLIRGWLVPDEPAPPESAPPEGWGTEAIGAELSAAREAVGRTQECLAAAGNEADAAGTALDRVGATELAAAYRRLNQHVDTHRGEIAEIADQIRMLTTAAAGTAEQPTPRAIVTTLTSLLEDIGVTILAILGTSLLSAHRPVLDPILDIDRPDHLVAQLGAAREQLGAARGHLDRAREAVAATLTVTGDAGGTR